MGRAAPAAGGKTTTRDKLKRKLGHQIAKQKLASRVKKSKLEKQLENERESLEKEMISDIEVRTRGLEEESERSALSELDRGFRAERDTMETALALRKQEITLEMEVEMEQRVSDFVNKREKEMISNLEKQLSKKGNLSKKEVTEMIKTMQSEIKVKMETAFLEARQKVLDL